MKSNLTVKDICKGLGVAPAAADRIEGLLRGRIDPSRFRELEPSLPGILGAPSNVMDVLSAVAKLLDYPGGVVTLHDDEDEVVAACADVEDIEGLTVAYVVASGEFIITTAESLKAPANV